MLYLSQHKMIFKYTLHTWQKQILGAVTGAVIAMALYWAYGFVGPTVDQYVLSFFHSASVEQYTDGDRDAMQESIVEQVRQRMHGAAR
jgi:hypothetical protein